jgi:hypothetical protein
MRRALLGQATSGSVCLGDARSAEVSSDQLRRAKVWAKVLKSKPPTQYLLLAADFVVVGLLGDTESLRRKL